MSDVKLETKPEGYFSCPVRRTMCIVGGKWKLLIIKSLLEEPLRFNELKRRTGKISQRLLTAQLRALEDDGLVLREIFNVMPPHVEYSLTEKGMSIKSVVDALSIWGEKELALDKKMAT